MKNKTIFFSASLIFCLMYILSHKERETGDLQNMGNIINTIIIALNFFVLGYFGYFVFKINSQKTPAQLKRYILPLFLIFILGALAISLIFISVGNYVFYLMGGFESAQFMKKLYQVELPEAIQQFMIWIPVIFGFLFYMLWRQTISREQKLHEENLKYQYQTLKTQVNPHFLFNTLNTLSEIVYIDPRIADNYIQQLSGIYRYILENEKNDLVSLRKELEFIMQYFELQQERDKNKVQLKVDIMNADEFRIVPISLQILIENALKHNCRSEEKPLMISIYKNENYIVVSNNIQRKSILKNTSTGIGLPNLIKRVQLITNKDVIISQKNNVFLVKLPIISF